MFGGVGVLLALCAFFAREGALGKIGAVERYMAHRCERLTWWSWVRVLLLRVMWTREETRVREGMWILWILLLYGASVVYVVWPVAGAVWLDAACPPEAGVTPVLAVTVGMLVLPLIVFTRATTARGLTALCSVIAVAVFLSLALAKDTCVWNLDQGGEPVAESRLTDEERRTVEEAIQFDFGRADVTDSAEVRLRRKVKVLDDRESVVLCIEGHADELGTTEYNDDLGGRRAERVLRFFEKEHLDLTRFGAVSHGEGRPRNKAAA